MEKLHYIGKNADNQPLAGKFDPRKVLADACDRHLAGDPAGIQTVRALLPSMLKVLKNQNRDQGGERRELAALWAGCVQMAAERLGPLPVLYSDESLTESMSGLRGELAFGDDVALEQLHDVGFLEHASLSVVLREPAEFLQASYYKAMEFQQGYGGAPFSFDEYIRRQLAIYERKPSASRIFLGMHRAASAHFRSLCPATVLTTYRELAGSAHALDTLLGIETGEVPVCLADLPRDNQSWRQPKTNDFILQADGVAPGMTIQQYAGTFADVLARRGLDRMFAADAQ
ncbi:MAG: hypothetical protein JWQ07_459 [Ramlibacter sp.]|nr:hypothetical protein [Ramlibacter sp.]